MIFGQIDLNLPRLKRLISQKDQLLRGNRRASYWLIKWPLMGKVKVYGIA